MSFAQEMRDFASGYKAVAETNRRSRYDRDTENKAEDIYAGYGGEENAGGSFMDKLKGFFGGSSDKPSEGAVPAPEGNTVQQTASDDPREKIFSRLNSSYKAAEKAGDLKGMETILKNMQRLKVLPGSSAPSQPVAKPAVKAAPKPQAAPDAAPKNYGLPDPLQPKPKASPQALPDQVDNSTLEMEEAVDPEMFRRRTLVANGGLIEEDTEALPVTPASYEVPQQEEPDNVARDMTEMAMPGYAAAYRKASQELSPAAGVPDEAGDETRTAAFLRGDNAAKPDEVKAIDAIIDPENKLPPQAKSQARIAAIWKYYSERGEDDKAADLINRLSAYDRRNSQTRGMLAMRAMEDGNTEAAVKIIKDAYEQDLPGDQLIQPAVLQNGNIKADVIQGGQVVESIEATPQEFKGLIQKVASGQAHSQQALGLITQYEANKKKSKSGGGSSGPAIDEDIKRGLLTTRRAYAQALSERDDSPEWQEYFNKVKAAVQAQEDRAIAFADKAGGKDRDTILRSLGVTNVPTAATVPSPSRNGGKLNQSNVPTKKNSKGQDEVDEVEVLRRRIQNADILEQHGVRIDENGKAIDKREPGYKPTKEEREAARASIEPLRQKLKIEYAKKVYDEVEDSPGYKENYKSRLAENEEALNEFLGVSAEELALKKSRGEKLDPLMEKGQPRRDYLRMIDSIRRKNDNLDPVDIAKFIDGVAKDGQYQLTIDDKGRVVYGGKRLYINDETMEGIARLRAAAKAEAAKPKEPPKQSGTARILGAVGSEVGGAIEKGNQNLQVRDAQGNNINILSIPGRMIDRLGEKRLTVPIPEDTTPMQARPPMTAPQNDPRGRWGSGKRALPVD